MGLTTFSAPYQPKQKVKRYYPTEVIGGIQTINDIVANMSIKKGILERRIKKSRGRNWKDNLCRTISRL